jgi:hypothetical protein
LESAEAELAGVAVEADICRDFLPVWVEVVVLVLLCPDAAKTPSKITADTLFQYMSASKD